MVRHFLVRKTVCFAPYSLNQFLQKKISLSLLVKNKNKTTFSGSQQAKSCFFLNDFVFVSSSLVSASVQLTVIGKKLENSSVAVCGTLSDKSFCLRLVFFASHALLYNKLGHLITELLNLVLWMDWFWK